MKYYIIYEITNKINKKKYIGCHVTKNLNDDYMGSGTYLKKALNKYGIDNFDKIILHFCDNEIEMLEKEKSLVNEDIVKSDNYYNLTIGGHSFYHINSNLDKYRHYNQNKVVVKDKLGNISKVDTNNIKFLNGELISVCKNKIICKDKNNNYYSVLNDDIRYKNGELVPINKGFVLVKDKDDKILFVSKDDERYKNGELVIFWKNRKHTKETKDKIGLKNSIQQKGNKNSQFGSCWIMSEIEKKCKKIKKDELNNYIKKGWSLGRKMNW